MLARSTLLPADTVERVRQYTRAIEFDYIEWIFDALTVRGLQNALGAERYLPTSTQHDLVMEYMDLVQRQEQTIYQVTRIYADPAVEDSQSASRELRQELGKITARLDEITPLAESTLQLQVSRVISSLGLAVGGQPIPPVWYHSTPLPLALIVSPRDTIRQEANISVLADLNIDQITALEDKVSSSQGVSTLVVHVGGIGVYPTMVMRSGDLTWVGEVVAHEWIHNYLTLRPLGINYDTSPELRTMNETAANIAGQEIGRALLEANYPELLPAPAPEASAPSSSTARAEAPVFSFNAEMHRVRLHVDELLTAGKIAEAETYMDQSRRTFLDNGYVVRKINQAYFAFYGAYADEPSGPAGVDPVGPAVRTLRQQSASLVDFLERISRMTSFQQLEAAIQ
jgi:hypothetical protein